MYDNMQQDVTLRQHYYMMLQWCYDYVTTMYMYSILCYNIVTTMLQVCMCLLQGWYDDTTTMCNCITTRLQHSYDNMQLSFRWCFNVTLTYNNVQCYATMCTHVLVLLCYFVMLCNELQLCATVVEQCDPIVTMLQQCYNYVTTTLHNCYISY